MNTPFDLFLYDSLSKQKKALKPLSKGKISLYVCGVTVYDDCHVGHARVLLVFDCLYRVLRYLGYDVTYIRNITDIDDKILKRAMEAQKEGQPFAEAVSALTQRYIQSMQSDSEALKILPPNVEPRATAYIPEMVNFIQDLLEKSVAYLGENGDVYFSVAKYPDYGALSHRKLGDLRAGERVKPDPFKRDPLDFVLWKKAKPGDLDFEAPFGRGRPGWHIECSAMALANLKKAGHPPTLDIHGGGHDLQFPHHENERAQSEAKTGCCFANLWMHVGFVNVNQDKMSKSLNNFVRIRDCLDQYHPEVLRYLMLSTHYRSPLQYSEEAMGQAKAALSRLYRIHAKLALLVSQAPCLNTVSYSVEVQAYRNSFLVALTDDLNTPLALSMLFDMARQLQQWQTENLDQKTDEKAQAIQALHQIWLESAGILGLLQEKPEAFLEDRRHQALQLTAEEIQAHLKKREALRAEKRFKEADAIRDFLLKNGYVTADKKTGF